MRTFASFEEYISWYIATKACLELDYRIVHEKEPNPKYIRQKLLRLLRRDTPLIEINVRRDAIR